MEPLIFFKKSLNSYKFSRVLKSYLILILILSCGSDDVSMDESVNLPPLMSSEYDIFFNGNSVTISWEAATDPEDDAVSYELEVLSKSENSGSVIEAYNLVGNFETTSLSYTLENIDRSVKHRVYIRSTDIFNNMSMNRLTVEFENNSPSSITDVLIDKNESSVDVSWSPAIDNDDDTINYQIDLYQYIGTPVSEPVLINSFNTSQTNYTISNLEQFVKYEIRILASDGFGQGSTSTPYIFTLLSENTYVGDIILREQSDVDVFIDHNIQNIEGDIIFGYPITANGFPINEIQDISALAGFENISGNLIITNYNFHTFTQDLSAFNSLQTVDGTLLIEEDYDGELGFSDHAINLNDFVNLQHVGNLEMKDIHLGAFGSFNSLNTINGNIIISGNCQSNTSTLRSIAFPNLESVGGSIDIVNNGCLENISDFPNLQSIGLDVNIIGNSHLSEFPSFENINTINGSINVSGNLILTSMNTFNSLILIDGSISLLGNNLLTNLQSFSSLTSIGNSLTFKNNTSLNNLQPLTSLVSIGSSLTFENNTSLENLELFSSLVTIGESIIFNNTNFSDLSFIDNITSIEKLNLVENDNLVSLSLDNINYLKELDIRDNPLLSSLNFPTVNVSSTAIVNIKIRNNPNLTAITGLNGFSHFDSLELINNPLLTNTSGLNNITQVDNCLQIYNNDDLTNLNFLSNLYTISCGDVCSEIFGNGSTSNTNNLVIKGNFNLGDYCGLTDFFSNNGLCFEEYSILENGYNPTHLDIINGSCSN